MPSPEQKIFQPKSEVADPQIDELYRRAIGLMYEKSTPGSRGVKIRSFDEALRLALNEYPDKYKKPWRYYFSAVGKKMNPAPEKKEALDPEAEASLAAKRSKEFWEQRRDARRKQLRDEFPLIADQMIAEEERPHWRE